MRVIVPIEITTAKLISTTVAEPDLGASWGAYSSAMTYDEHQRVTSGGKVYQSRKGLNLNNALPVAPEALTYWWDTVTEANYSSATTYALGDRVVDTSSHRQYESLQAANVGHLLPVYPETVTDWWMDVGATNRWACLDVARNTQTVSVSPLVVQIMPGVRFNSLALMGVDCDSVTVTTNFGYSFTKSMADKAVIDYYQYFFSPFAYERGLVLFDIPPITGTVVTVTLTRNTNPVRLGSIVAGNFVYLGDVQYNPVSDYLNFSSIERDLYGTATLIPRRALPKTQQTLMVDKLYVNDIRTARAALNAVPAVWVGLPDTTDGYYDSLLIVGIYRAFSIDLAYPNQAKINLELEEI